LSESEREREKRTASSTSPDDGGHWHVAAVRLVENTNQMSSNNSAAGQLIRMVN